MLLDWLELLLLEPITAIVSPLPSPIITEGVSLLLLELLLASIASSFSLSTIAAVRATELLLDTAIASALSSSSGIGIMKTENCAGCS